MYWNSWSFIVVIRGNDLPSLRMPMACCSFMDRPWQRPTPQVKIWQFRILDWFDLQKAINDILGRAISKVSIECTQWLILVSITSVSNESERKHTAHKSPDHPEFTQKVRQMKWGIFMNGIEFNFANYFCSQSDVQFQKSTLYPVPYAIRYCICFWCKCV